MTVFVSILGWLVFSNDATAIAHETCRLEGRYTALHFSVDIPDGQHQREPRDRERFRQMNRLAIADLDDISSRDRFYVFR